MSKFIPDWLIAKIPIKYIIANLPPRIKAMVFRTSMGKRLLWNMAKSGMKAKVGLTREWQAADLGRFGLFLVWWPCELRLGRSWLALYILYTYMLKQRKRVLGKGRTLAKKRQ
jgi:very-long-chain (3R)-3-hydroxyacyl-CoA dehydratase